MRKLEQESKRAKKGWEHLLQGDDIKFMSKRLKAFIAANKSTTPKEIFCTNIEEYPTIQQRFDRP